MTSSAYVKSNGEWTARCIVMGFFVAPVEALPEINVTDVYFTHQRGTYMGIYALSLAGSNYFAPIICGFIADGQGWQWVFYWPAIFLTATFIFLFIMLEETNYNRRPYDADQVLDYPPSTEVDKERGDTATARSRTSIDRGHSTKTFVSKLSIWQPSVGNNMLERAKRSLQYLTWPVIFYAGLSYGSYLIWFNVLNATVSD